MHLPKKDPQDDGTVKAEDMRPIVVECTLWRVVVSAMTRTDEMSKWTDTCIHQDQYGAVAGRSLMAAVQKVDMAREQGHALLSLDLGEVLRPHWPRDRSEHARGARRPQAPHGDAQACLAGPAQMDDHWQICHQRAQEGAELDAPGRRLPPPRAQRHHEPGPRHLRDPSKRERDIPRQEYEHYTYLDDRSYTAKHIRHIKEIRQIWIDLVADLEGEENTGKAALLAKTFDQDRAVEEDEDLRPIIVRTLRLLGVDFLRKHSEA